MQAAHRLLQDLVRLPSVNPMGRPVTGDIFHEVRLTDYLERFFKDLGVSFDRQTIAPERDNIVARFDSPKAPFTVLFEVHQDTVPVDGMVIDPIRRRGARRQTIRPRLMRREGRYGGDADRVRAPGPRTTC